MVKCYILSTVGIILINTCTYTYPEAYNQTLKIIIIILNLTINMYKYLHVNVCEMLKVVANKDFGRQQK